jgi:hypothetical protein
LQPQGGVLFGGVGAFHNVAPALTALNFMSNLGGLSKDRFIVSSEVKIAPTLLLSFVCLKKLA